jgi:ankyrin repeat protein
MEDTDSDLEKAVLENHPDDVEQLLSLPVQRKAAEKAYHLALRHDHTEVIRMFFKAAIDGPLTDVIDPISVFQHALSKEQLDIVDMVVTNRRFDANSEEPWTNDRPLAYSVFSNHLELAGLLVQRGAVIDAINSKGLTALGMGCMRSSVDCCRLLLSHGAEANPTGSSGASPLWLTYSFSNSREIFREIVDLLLVAALNLNKEQWLLRSPQRNSIDQDTLHHLKSLCNVPLTLKMSCFVTIRRHLANKNHGISIRSHVKELPLPPTLKRFLTLENTSVAVT